MKNVSFCNKSSLKKKSLDIRFCQTLNTGHIGAPDASVAHHQDDLQRVQLLQLFRKGGLTSGQDHKPG
jgi:hypothetical protein